MPFTFAHPAIILPLAKRWKRWFSLTGLVIGSIAPDFEYFFRMNTMSTHSHSISGIFYFNLPLALVLAFIFHQIIRNPLIDHLPGGLYGRFCRFKTFSWPEYFKKRYIIVLSSIIIGAFSHIFWDSFTFEGGFFAVLFNIDQHKFFSIPLNRIIQHGSTVIGFCYIAWVIYRMDKSVGVKTCKTPPFNWYYWITVALTIIVVWLIKLNFDGLIGRRDLVVTLINGFLIGLLLSSFINKGTDQLFSK